MASAAQTDLNTPITVKLTLDGHPRRFKLALRDVGIDVLEEKVSLAAHLGRPYMPCDCNADTNWSDHLLGADCTEYALRH